MEPAGGDVRPAGRRAQAAEGAGRRARGGEQGQRHEDGAGHPAEGQGDQGDLYFF